MSERITGRRIPNLDKNEGFQMRAKRKVAASIHTTPLTGSFKDLTNAFAQYAELATDS